MALSGEIKCNLLKKDIIQNKVQSVIQFVKIKLKIVCASLSSKAKEQMLMNDISTLKSKEEEKGSNS